MFILVTYDVDTTTKEGRRRLHRVAKKCINYGKRVQDSVFECVVDYTQYTILKKELAEIIDSNADSVRLYNLGNNYSSHIDTIGVDTGTKVDGELIL